MSVLRVLATIWIGGAVGTVARYEVALAMPPEAGTFPWATFVVNVAGSFVLGALMVLILERWPPTRYARPLGGIGFCGGLTTFSTWMVEGAVLTKDGHVGVAVLSVVAGMGAGLVAVALGAALFAPRVRGGGGRS